MSMFAKITIHFICRETGTGEIAVINLWAV